MAKKRKIEAVGAHFRFISRRQCRCRRQIKYIYDCECIMLNRSDAFLWSIEKKLLIMMVVAAVGGCSGDGDGKWKGKPTLLRQ